VVFLSFFSATSLRYPSGVTRILVAGRLSCKNEKQRTSCNIVQHTSSVRLNSRFPLFLKFQHDWNKTNLRISFPVGRVGRLRATQFSWSATRRFRWAASTLFLFMRSISASTDCPCTMDGRSMTDARCTTDVQHCTKSGKHDWKTYCWLISFPVGRLCEVRNPPPKYWSWDGCPARVKNNAHTVILRKTHLPFV